jgi:hypothetical protein
MGWVARNWGNVASVFGLLLALCAFFQARSAKRAAARALKHEELLRISLALERGISLGEELHSSKSKVWSQTKCRTLRQHLARLQHSDQLTDDERDRVKVAVAFLRRPVKNNAQAKQWIDELIDSLIGMQERVAKTTREVIP